MSFEFLIITIGFITSISSSISISFFFYEAPVSTSAFSLFFLSNRDFTSCIILACFADSLVCGGGAKSNLSLLSCYLSLFSTPMNCLNWVRDTWLQSAETSIRNWRIVTQEESPTVSVRRWITESYASSEALKFSIWDLALSKSSEVLLLEEMSGKVWMICIRFLYDPWDFLRAVAESDFSICSFDFSSSFEILS